MRKIDWIPKGMQVVVSDTQTYTQFGNIVALSGWLAKPDLKVLSGKEVAG
jgi:hypothetical protein